MCLIKQLRMFRPKITKMRAIKEAMPLIPNSPGGAEGASAKCRGTAGLSSLPCSTGRACEPILKWRIDLSFLMENDRS